MNLQEDFKTRISNEANELVRNFFPSKIIEFDELLRKDRFSLTNISEVHKSTIKSLRNVHEILPDSDQGKAQYNKTVFSTNEYIVGLVELVKPEIVVMLEAVNTLRMWVTLLIPKIEDGNNFGVEVQEETLNELKSVEQDLASNQDEIAGYFLSRAKVITQLAKKPGVKDYSHYIMEEDEKQFVGLRLMVAELRNACSSLHDIISKNIDKIRSPRNQSNFSNIY